MAAFPATRTEEESQHRPPDLGYVSGVMLFRPSGKRTDSVCEAKHVVSCSHGCRLFLFTHLIGRPTYIKTKVER